MKKKIIILTLSLVSCLATATSRPIMIRARSTFQHTRMRMPSARHISADYENGIITLNISAYTGNVQVYVYDLDGSIVAYDYTTISGNGSLTINVGNMLEGDYIISVVLDNDTYSGEFQV